MVDIFNKFTEDVYTEESKISISLELTVEC